MPGPDSQIRLDLVAPDRKRLRVLCMGAHSDDIEIGCGATLLSLMGRRPRPEFRWIVWSAAEQREREARLGARRFLGNTETNEVRVHAFRDGYFPAQFAEIKEAFENLAR